MIGAVQSLFRYPVKGFTPDAMTHVHLNAGGFFPDDRRYAVENGPSGFDPTAPAFTAKTKFTVLAQMPALAAIRTVFDAGRLSAIAPDGRNIAAHLDDAQGRTAFATWLAEVLDPEEVRGPLRVVSAPHWHFTDHPQGFVSILNLASLSALGERMGVVLDPLRFRANIHVEGWDAWAETQWASGARLIIGGSELELFKPIVRCMAINANPTTGERDIDLIAALRELDPRIHFGLYARVVSGGDIKTGDPARAEP